MGVDHLGRDKGAWEPSASPRLERTSCPRSPDPDSHRDRVARGRGVGTGRDVFSVLA